MDRSAVVLTNIPASYSEKPWAQDLITDYIETADEAIRVEEVILSSVLAGTALVITEDKIADFAVTQRAIHEKLLDSQRLQLLETNIQPATIVVNFDDDKLLKDHLQKYFIQKLGERQDAIESMKFWPGKKMAIVKFHASCKKKVLDQILREKSHVLLFPKKCQVYLSPFYTNFHDSIVKHLDMEHTTETKRKSKARRKTQTKYCVSSEDHQDSDEQSDNDNIAEIQENTSTEDEETEEEEYVDCQVSSKGEGDNDTDEENTEEDTSSDEDEENEGQEETEESRLGATWKSTKISKVKEDKKQIKEVVGDYDEDDSDNDGDGYNKNDGDDHFIHPQKVKNTLKLNERKTEPRKSQAYKDNFARNSSHHTSVRGRRQSRHPENGHVQAERKNDKKVVRHTEINDRPKAQRTSQYETSKGRECSDNSAQEKRFESSPRGAGRGRGIGRGGALNIAYLRRHERDNRTIGMSQNNRQEMTSAFLLPPSTDQKEKSEQHRLLEEKVRKQKELNARLKDFDRLQLDLESWRATCLQHCFGKFEEYSVKYDRHREQVILAGPKAVINSHQLTILRGMNELCSEEIELNPTIDALLSTPVGEKFIRKLCSNFETKIFHYKKSIIVVTDKEDDLRTIGDKVRQRIAHKKKWSTENEIPLDKLITLQASLEHSLLVKISWDDKQKEIVCEGIQDDVQSCCHDIETLIQDTANEVKTFTVRGYRATYFKRFHLDEMSTHLEGVELVNPKIISEQEISVSFKGTRKTVNQMYERLYDLMIHVDSRSWDIKSEFGGDVDPVLIANACKSLRELNDKIKYLEYAYNCCVITQYTPADTFNPTIKPQKSQRYKADETKQSKFRVNVTSTCQLIIKSYGNIVKEQSEMLVCLLTQHVDLRKTGVGKAFNKAYSSLWEALAVEKKANPSDSVLLTKGPFERSKCKAICYVILPPWDPNTSPAQLEKSVKLVFEKAVALNVASVSFPALGCGRAHQFPPDVVAQIFLSNIIETSVCNNLSKIVFLATEASLYTEFQREALMKFQTLDVKADNEHSDDNGTQEGEEISGNAQLFTPELQMSDDLKITIVSKNDIPRIWLKLKEVFQDICLYGDDFTPKDKIVWPSESCQSIIHEAERLFVWMEMYQQLGTKKSWFKLKGEKNAVFQMKEFIDGEYVKVSQDRPKEEGLKSSLAPSRGTVDFLKYAMDHDVKYPSYWNLSKAQKKKRADQQSDGEQGIIVDVDSKTKAVITQLVRDTLVNNKIGHGNDARNLQYSDIQVIKVERVENPHLFEIYQRQRKTLFRKIMQQHHICHDVGNKSTYPNSKGSVATTMKLDDSMKEELYYEINEHYLFHGAPKNVIPALIYSGLDPRVANEFALFGKGIYTAEMFTKSDQYADGRNDRKPLGTELQIILYRILLGNPYFCDENHKTIMNNKQGQKLLRPPCMSCNEDNCTCGKDHYDSVIGDGMWIFREFVVYDKNQCYPEYIITYKRI